MKKIWDLLKAILAKLFHRGSPKLAMETEVPIKESPKVEAIGYTHNMRKYQPCPKGDGWKKRLAKTLGGANYWCNQCNSSFFVSRRG